ncbi:MULTISPECIES: alpha/beta hydrolase [Halolamina]|uniref:Lysophospholipase, alpha-beta hydrolase superfamily n=1 Tax=Halolamina pelagica TaxID=699431 RepID=A0A1I5M675_9EURY|nr:MULTISPECIES: alpha/beta hydrolase [Halolamina]NHX35883.1 alpha/beta fold hydrolase [Halolamina sp. R1-12]SFP05039.1 Lysophospholipase, alpha-beta hydrolase superfamily [Halolamina pelagica]
MSHAARGKPSRYAFSTRRVEFDGRQGHLFTPDRPADAPIVVLAPGAGLPWRATLEPTVERLAARGYAAFAFDHRGFGHVDGDHLLSPSRQRADLDAAVEAARDAPEVDGDRLALWGLDLSAGTALAAAADAVAVDAVIARFPVLAGARLLPSWVRPRLRGLGRGVADYPVSALGRLRGVDADERGLRVPLFGESDEVAAIAADGATRAVRDVLGREPGTAPARSLVKLQRHDVREAVEGLTCPALFVAGEHDEFAPPEPVVAATDDVRNASLVRVPASHYGALDGAELERTLNYELAFLDAEL